MVLAHLCINAIANDKNCKWLTSVGSVDKACTDCIRPLSDLETGVEGSGLVDTCFVGYTKS